MFETSRLILNVGSGTHACHGCYFFTPSLHIEYYCTIPKVKLNEKKESQLVLNSQISLVQDEVHKHPLPLNTYCTYILLKGHT